MSGALRLRSAVSPLAHHRALLDGTVTVPGVEFDWVDVPRLPDIFLRMGRGQEFDLCEFTVMSYFAAREHGLPISAIPVVPRHQFQHGDFRIHAGASIAEPRDLEGKRVGTRSWTLTPGVLDRGLLRHEYGVDLSTITWVVSDVEHVEACERLRPDNVVALAPGSDLFAALAAGEIDAGIAGSNVRRQESSRVSPLFQNSVELDRAQYERTGIVPAFTVIAVHDRALAGRPWLAEALFEGFREARRHGTEPDPSVARVVVSDDQSPFGLQANRRSFDHLFQLGREQGILMTPRAADDLFPDLN